MEKALTPEDREIAYSLGYEHYQAGEFRKAKHLFTTLVFSDPGQALYWRGLASTLQMLERYAEAAQAWALLALLNERDPLPHFHAAECLLAVSEKGEAKKALRCAQQRASAADKQLKEKIKCLTKKIV